MPGIDLWFAGLFYDPQDGFFLSQPAGAVQLLPFRYMPFFLVRCCSGCCNASWRWGGEASARLRRSIVLLVVTLAIGRDHRQQRAEGGIGRARPSPSRAVLAATNTL